MDRKFGKSIKKRGITPQNLTIGRFPKKIEEIVEMHQKMTN